MMAVWTLNDMREDYQNCSVLCCVPQLCAMTRTHIQAVLVQATAGLGLTFCMFCCVDQGPFCLCLSLLFMFTFSWLLWVCLSIQVGLQSTAWKDRPRSELLCVERDVSFLVKIWVLATVRLISYRYYSHAVGGTYCLNWSLECRISHITWAASVLIARPLDAWEKMLIWHNPTWT